MRAGPVIRPAVTVTAWTARLTAGDLRSVAVECHAVPRLPVRLIVQGPCDGGEQPRTDAPQPCPRLGLSVGEVARGEFDQVSSDCSSRGPDRCQLEAFQHRTGPVQGFAGGLARIGQMVTRSVCSAQCSASNPTGTPTAKRSQSHTSSRSPATAMFHGVQSPCQAPRYSGTSPSSFSIRTARSASVAAARGVGQRRDPRRQVRPVGGRGQRAALGAADPGHLQLRGADLFRRRAAPGARHTGRGDWTSSSSPFHCPMCSTSATVVRRSPAPPTVVEGVGLGPDQAAGQGVDAHLDVGDGAAGRREDLQDGLAVRARRAQVHAHDDVGAEHRGQVCLDRRRPAVAGPVEHADPVAQQERCDARAQAGGEPGGEQPGSATPADPVAPDGGHGGAAAAGHEQPRAAGAGQQQELLVEPSGVPARADGELQRLGPEQAAHLVQVRHPVAGHGRPLRMRTGTAMRGVSVASCSASSSRLLRQSSASDRKEITSGMVRAL